MKLLDSSAWPIPFHPSWNIIDSTKLNCFKACPRKFFYEYGLGWRPDTPSNHLVFGASVHLALEHLLLHGCEPKTVNDAYQIFLEDYRKTLDPQTDEWFFPKTPDILLLVLAKYAAKYRHDLRNYKIHATEISGRITVDEDLFLAFRMDSLVQRNSDGKFGSLEHKTSTSTYYWADQWTLSIQVGTYLHVLNCLYDDIYGVEIDGLFFYKRPRVWAKYFDTGSFGNYQPPYEFQRHTVNITGRKMQNWQFTVLHYLYQIQDNFEALTECSDSDDILRSFPLRDDSCFNYGKPCPYYDFCCTWPNPLQRCYEPPIGFEISFWDPLEKESKKEINL